MAVVKKDEELDTLEHALWKIHKDTRGGGTREERKTESEVWDRLSSAGGPFEGGERFKGKVASNTITIKVLSLSDYKKR